MRSLDIVIAYYSKPLGWLTRLIERLQDYEHIRIYIYAKGKVLPSVGVMPENVEGVLVRRRENVGRNDETFLYHITAYYDELADSVLFLKDSTLKDVHAGRSTGEKMDELVRMLKTSDRQGYMCNPTDYTDGWEEDDDMKNFTIDDWNPTHKQSGGNFILAEPRGLLKWVQSRLKHTKDAKRLTKMIKHPEEQKICYSGVFAATRKAIHRSSRKTYGRLGSGLQQGDNVEAGHYVERIWGLLFAEN